MQPEPPSACRRATIVDLLDRVLDKGLFLRADLIVSVAGIPLIGVTLSAAVAGIETLAEYGIMSDWDEAIQAQPSDRRKVAPPVNRTAGSRADKSLAVAVPA